MPPSGCRNSSGLTLSCCGKYINCMWPKQSLGSSKSCGQRLKDLVWQHGLSLSKMGFQKAELCSWEPTYKDKVLKGDRGGNTEPGSSGLNNNNNGHLHTSAGRRGWSSLNPSSRMTVLGVALCPSKGPSTLLSPAWRAGFMTKSFAVCLSRV